MRTGLVQMRAADQVPRTGEFTRELHLRGSPVLDLNSSLRSVLRFLDTARCTAGRPPPSRRRE
jgi:hypothetical protein